MISFNVKIYDDQGFDKTAIMSWFPKSRCIFVTGEYKVLMYRDLVYCLNGLYEIRIVDSLPSESCYFCNYYWHHNSDIVYPTETKEKLLIAIQQYEHNFEEEEAYNKVTVNS
jgi:hypothetical protein